MRYDHLVILIIRAMGQSKLTELEERANGSPCVISRFRNRRGLKINAGNDEYDGCWFYGFPSDYRWRCIDAVEDGDPWIAELTADRAACK